MVGRCMRTFFNSDRRGKLSITIATTTRAAWPNVVVVSRERRTSSRGTCTRKSKCNNKLRFPPQTQLHRAQRAARDGGDETLCRSRSASMAGVRCLKVRRAARVLRVTTHSRAASPQLNCDHSIVILRHEIATTRRPFGREDFLIEKNLISELQRCESALRCHRRSGCRTKNFCLFTKNCTCKDFQTSYDYGH